MDLVKTFQETGWVCNKVNKHPRILNKAAQVAVLGNFAIDPTSLSKTV